MNIQSYKALQHSFSSPPLFTFPSCLTYVFLFFMLALFIFVSVHNGVDIEPKEVNSADNRDLCLSTHYMSGIGSSSGASPWPYLIVPHLLRLLIIISLPSHHSPTFHLSPLFASSRPSGTSYFSAFRMLFPYFFSFPYIMYACLNVADNTAFGVLKAFSYFTSCTHLSM